MTRRGRMGTILSPRHTLPPNTTCTYYFHGIPTDLVWVSFASYHLQILQPSSNDNTTVARVSTHKKEKNLGQITQKCYDKCNTNTNKLEWWLYLHKSNKWAFFRSIETHIFGVCVCGKRPAEESVTCDAFIKIMEQFLIIYVDYC